MREIEHEERDAVRRWRKHDQEAGKAHLVDRVVALLLGSAKICVMTVKDREPLSEALDRAESRLREAVEDVQRTRAALDAQPAGELTVKELAAQSGVGEEAVLAFATTAGKLLAHRPLSAQDARRAALLAVSGQAWEDELGPLFGTGEVRELLGVSRQRVNELVRKRRLIAVTDRSGRVRYPAFQFEEDGPIAALVSAFWTVADQSNGWTAASWCVAPDAALDGLSPLQWSRDGREPARLERVAHQDAARLAA